MKLVKESIQFKREEDPYDALGVGTRELIEKWLIENKIRNYIINEDLTIDVTKGGVYVLNTGNFPDYIQFNKVVGTFGVNSMLTSLRGCPKEVTLDFECFYTNKGLYTLEGCPEIVGRNFIVGHLSITSLKGGPKKVNGNYIVSYNMLESMEGAPEHINGSFDCTQQMNNKVFRPRDILKYCDVKGNIKVMNN